MRAEIASYVCTPMCVPTLLCMDVRNHTEIIQMASNKIMDNYYYYYYSIYSSIMLSFALIRYMNYSC